MKRLERLDSQKSKIMYNSIKREYIPVKTENIENPNNMLEEEGNDSEEDEDLSSVVNVLI